MTLSARLVRSLAAATTAFAAALAPLPAQQLLFHVAPPKTTPPMWSIEVATSGADVGDVDGDGVADLLLGEIFGNPGGASGSATRLFSGKTRMLIDSYGGGPIAGLGDVDADGVPDFAAGGSVRSLQKGVLSAVDPTTIALAGLGDVDGDGGADYVSATAGPVGGNFETWIHLVSGRTGAVLRSVPASPQEVGVTLHRTSDFDGDGFSDFVEHRTSGVVVRSPRTLGVLASLAIASESFAVLGDSDGDGLDELLFGSAAASGGAGTVAIVSMAQGGSTLRTLTGAPGEGLGAFRVAAVGDVEGDGGLELAAGTKSGAVRVFTATDGTLVATIPAPAGTWPGAVGPLWGGRDYDADGRPDLVVLSGGSGLDAWGNASGTHGWYRTIGNGCPGPSGRATVVGLLGQTPHVDATFTAVVANLPPSASVAMLLGLSNTSLAGIALPLPLDSIGMPGCTLYTSGNLAFPLTNAGGQATWTFVPQASSLAVRFWNQAVIFAPGVNRLGLLLSDAAEGRVGL